MANNLTDLTNHLVDTAVGALPALEHQDSVEDTADMEATAALVAADLAAVDLEAVLIPTVQDSVINRRVVALEVLVATLVHS